MAKRLSLVPNWKAILKRSYSIWFGAYLPLLWLLIPEIVFYLTGRDWSPTFVWIVAFLLASITPIVRILRQGIDYD